MKSPFFIIGNPRSGTTLLRLMLNNHRNIIVPPECGFAVWWYEKYKDWSKDSCQDKKARDYFLQDLIASKKIETWNLDFEGLGEYIRSMMPINYAELVSCIYTFFGYSTGRTFDRWGDKNNFHIQRVETLHKIFPSAFFIHIIRDGRDVACSYKNLAKMNLLSKYAPNLPTNIVDIATEWTKNIEMAISSFDAIGWSKVCEVHYEDLVAKSQVQLENICDFLDEPYDDRMLDYYLHNKEEQQEPLEFLQWKSKTLDIPTVSEVGKYKIELTKGEIKEFESIAKQVLVKYGYECST